MAPEGINQGDLAREIHEEIKSNSATKHCNITKIQGRGDKQLKVLKKYINNG